MWNAINYFEQVQKKLKLTKDEYTFCRVTGLNYLEDVLLNMNKSTAFLAVDDSDDGVSLRAPNGGYFNRRTIVVYILKKYKLNDQKDREEKLNETRTIFKSILSKLIKDSHELADLIYLDKNRIPYHEVPGYFSAGTAGLYFMITLEEPTDLQYNANDWI